MKKYLVIALAAVAMTACKKDSTPTAQLEEGDLMLTTKASNTKALLPNYAGNADNFFPQDELGFFMASEATTTEIADNYEFWGTPGVTAANNATNYGYIFGAPYWTPLLPDTEKLKYQKDAGVQLFAYFPRQANDNSVAGNPIKMPTAPVANTQTPDFECQIAENQTDAKILRMNDIMWSKNTGETANAGFLLSSKPVTMTFTHLMSRANFGVKLFNTQIATGATENYTLRAIIINGNEINTQKANLNIVSGKLTPTAVPNNAYNGRVYYFDNAVTGAFTTEVTDANMTAATAAVLNAGVDTKIDLLVYPFTQTATKNKFFFIFSDASVEFPDAAAGKSDFLTKYTTLAELEAGVIAGDKGLFMYSFDIKVREQAAAPTVAVTDKWIFDAGINNQMDVNADISSKAIDVLTTITPWKNLDAVEVPAE